MTPIAIRRRVRTASLLLPFAVLSGFACSDSGSGTPDGSSIAVIDSGSPNSTASSPGTPVLGPAGTNSSPAAPSSGGTEPAPPVTSDNPIQPPNGGAGAQGTGNGGSGAEPAEPASGGAGAEPPGPAANAGSGGTGDGSGAGTGGLASAGAGAAPDSGGASSGGTGSGSDPVFHIFMLMGQSNMAGVAPNEPGDRNTDERLLVLGGCNQPAGQWNIANPPLSDCPGEKGWNLSNSVDPGIWFGKTLLETLPEGDTIGLIGTAESGESINTFISGGSHHQMILNKIEMAKTAENGRFAGIIFHQGESDNGQSTWPDKVVQLYNEVKEAFGVDYDVPFILGELPEGGCCGGHNVRVHEAAEQLPMGYWVSQEGTNVMDEYHFDHASVVLMGQRYGETMSDALGW